MRRQPLQGQMGQRISGALGRDPKPQLQRVSPGVYRNAQGQLTGPGGRPQPRQAPQRPNMGQVIGNQLDSLQRQPGNANNYPQQVGQMLGNQAGAMQGFAPGAGQAGAVGSAVNAADQQFRTMPVGSPNVFQPDRDFNYMPYPSKFPYPNNMNGMVQGVGQSLGNQMQTKPMPWGSSNYPQDALNQFAGGQNIDPGFTMPQQMQPQWQTLQQPQSQPQYPSQYQVKQMAARMGGA